MKNTEIKIGDRVKCDEYASAKYGKIGVVINITNGLFTHRVKFDDGISNIYRPEDLILLNEKPEEVFFIKVYTVEHSLDVQTRLMELGYSWATSGYYHEFFDGLILVIRPEWKSITFLHQHSLMDRIKSKGVFREEKWIETTRMALDHGFVPDVNPEDVFMKLEDGKIACIDTSGVFIANESYTHKDILNIADVIVNQYKSDGSHV